MSGEAEPIVELVNIRKRYGQIDVLQGINCAMYKAQITALVGDNGAGKSTLIKIICGAHAQDEGRLIFDGKERRWHNPVEARRAGVETVYQDLALIDSMSIARNFFLAKEPLKNSFLKTLDQDVM